MGKEARKSSERRKTYGGGRLNLSSVGQRKPGSGYGIPSLKDGSVERDEVLEKRKGNIQGASDVGKIYRKKRPKEELHFSEIPISRKIVYGGICLASLGIGIAKTAGAKRGIEISGLLIENPGLTDFGVPIVGGLVGMIHEMGISGGDFLDEEAIYGAVGGGTGAYLCLKIGEYIGAFV